MLAGRTEPDSLLLHVPAGSVPLGYVREGEAIYLIARNRSAAWPVATLRSGTAEMTLPTGRLRGAARLVTDPAQQVRILDLFRVRYGPEKFARWYDHPARILEIRLAPNGVGAGPPSVYADWLEAEFDNVADDYDRHITGNRINRLLRDRSLARLRSTFAGAPHLLEIGCGSGMETLPLLREGHEMLCVDISRRMLEVVRTKAAREGISERLRTVQLRASELARLVRELGPGSFDGSYSTYGALNCEEDLRPLPPALHALLRADGRFLAGVYNRWCLFETLGYTLAAQPARAFGRRERPVPVGGSRFCVDIYAYSPTEFRRTFDPWFREEGYVGVPVLLPPSDLVGYAEKFSSHFDRLDAWDRGLGRHWPFRALGDHFLMTLVRRERPALGRRVPAA